MTPSPTEAQGQSFTESCWDCDGDGHIHGYDSEGNDTEDCPDAPECRCCEGAGFHTYDALRELIANPWERMEAKP